MIARTGHYVPGLVGAWWREAQTVDVQDMPPGHTVPCARNELEGDTNSCSGYESVGAWPIFAVRGFELKRAPNRTAVRLTRTSRCSGGR